MGSELRPPISQQPEDNPPASAEDRYTTGCWAHHCFPHVARPPTVGGEVGWYGHTGPSLDQNRGSLLGGSSPPGSVSSGRQTQVGLKVLPQRGDAVSRRQGPHSQLFVITGRLHGRGRGRSGSQAEGSGTQDADGEPRPALPGLIRTPRPRGSLSWSSTVGGGGEGWFSLAMVQQEVSLCLATCPRHPPPRLLERGCPQR